MIKKCTQPLFNKKIGWHFYGWIGATKYLMQRFHFRDQATTQIKNWLEL